MDLDKAFICRLLQEPGCSSVVEANVTEVMLFDESRAAYLFLSDFFRDHGKMPAIDTLEQNIGSEFREESPEPMSYYISLVKKRWKGNRINEALREADRVLVDKQKVTIDPDASIDVLKTALQEISQIDTVSGDIGLVDLRTNIDERWQDYLDVKKLGGKIDGYPFPWEAFNEATMGIHPGELWMVIARLKTGKSWLEIAMGEHFFRSGVSCLLVTMEMPISKMTKRIDAVFSSLPYGDFKRGRMDTDMEKKFSESLTSWTLPERPPFWVCGKGRMRTPQDLDLLIEELKPQVVLVDGIYLMKVKSRADSKWEKVSTIADELQDIGQRRVVPIIGTSQFGRKVNKNKINAGSEDIGFAYEIAQNADGVIGMFQPEEMKAGKEMLIRLMEHREGEPVNIKAHWDFANMNFTQKVVVSDADLMGDDDDDSGGRIQY